MTSARNFYLTFMKLANRVNKSTTKAQLAKNIDDYVQPLADCFDDDGLDIMDNYHLVSGSMVIDYGSEYPLIKKDCDSIRKNSIYECTTTQKPVKSYVGNQLVSTDKKTYEYLNYPSKKLIIQYMITLLDKAMDNTINRHNNDELGGFWIDRSGVTPKEEYKMRLVIGIKTPKNFVEKRIYKKHQKKLQKEQNIKYQIRTSSVHINELKADLKRLN